MRDITPDPIMRIAMGFMAAKHLFVASDIGLFEMLASAPATLDELTLKCDVPRRTLRISADAMVSLGLLGKQGERYCNTEATTAFLSGRRGHDLRPLLRFLDRISYPKWQELGDAVRTGHGQTSFGRFTEEEQRIFSAGMQSFSGLMAAALAASYDFGQHRRVLDVAGGTGSFLVAVLRSHAGLKGTLFDLPGACAVAREYLSREPEGKRIEVVEGDLFRDPLPNGHDALIVANTVHVLSAERNVELLKNMRIRVSPGARLLLADLWTDSTHTQPSAAALMSGEFLIIAGEGQAYSEKEAQAWLRQTGWRKLERKPLAGPASVIIAEAI
jgi:ubiquinone/menaquinone biosynthesis C-methylase UbiE